MPNLDFTDMTDEELSDLFEGVLDEMMDRGLATKEESLENELLPDNKLLN